MTHSEQVAMQPMPGPHGPCKRGRRPSTRAFLAAAVAYSVRAGINGARSAASHGIYTSRNIMWLSLCQFAPPLKFTSCTCTRTTTKHESAAGNSPGPLQYVREISTSVLGQDTRANRNNHTTQTRTRTRDHARYTPVSYTHLTLPTKA